MTFRLRATRRAEADAEAIYDWISGREQRPIEAVRFLDRLQDRISSLRDHPSRCPLAPEATIARRQIRQLLVHRHRVLFVIDGDEVVVLHIRHASRSPAEPGIME